MSSSSVSLLVILVFSANARAQELLWQADGNKFDTLGFRVGSTADLDGDGRTDVIAGAGGNNVVRLFSGATGALLRVWTHVPPSTRFGWAVADAGDVNADGVVDLLVGAPGGLGESGDAFVYSGADGLELHHFTGSAADDRLGYSVCGLGDVNGDGHADVAFGAPALTTRFNFSERVEVRSGADGSLLYAAFPAEPDDLFGFDIARMDDQDGDGVSELAVGCPNREHVVILNGKDGSLRLDIPSPTGTRDFFGVSVAKAGDFDADGFGELLVGGSYHTVGGNFATGIAHVISSASGMALRTFEGVSPGAALGVAVAGVPDASGDGVSDLMIGAPGAGSAELRSGRTGILLYRFKAKPEQALGTSVTGTGDLDGDGLGDLALGAPRASAGGTDRGRVVARLGHDLFLDSEPFAPAAGTTLSLTLAEGVPGNPALVALVDVNGPPMFQAVRLQPLDASGLLQLFGTIPAALSGSSIGLLGLTLSAGGRLLDSTVETIAIQ